MRQGWILVDILIGTVIIATALVAFGAAYRYSSINMVDSRNRVQAITVVQQEMENLKRYDNNTGLPTTWAATTSGIYTVQLQRIAVTEVSGLTTIIPVQITLTWQEQGASGTTTRTMQLVEYVLTN